MERLGLNQGGYRGATIDVRAVLAELDAAAQAHHWIIDRQGDFLAYRRPSAAPRKNVYLSAGIHGDEPAGPLAMRQLLAEDRWPVDLSLWVCPCLNPTGLARNTRENADGIDLNRDYRHLQTEEVRAHVGWLEAQPTFDLSLCLHEDWEAHGFYVYEVNPNQLPSFAETIVAAVAQVCPIEQAALIDDWQAAAGIIRPAVNPAERPQWPEALYLRTHKTQLGYTLEAPSDFPLPTRVAALVTGVRAVLDRL